MTRFLSLPRLFSASLAAWLLLASLPAMAQRHALIIANQNYAHAPRLHNPALDALLMQRALIEAGFKAADIVVLNDLTDSAFERAVNDFGRRSQGAEVALIYYAGHGLERDGINFLLPIDAKPIDMLALEEESVTVERLLRVTTGAHNRIIVLDACREDPFPNLADSRGATRSLRQGGLVTRGLMPIDDSDSAGPRTLIAFSTAEGAIADDGKPGEHSPFARSLAKWIATPGLEVAQIFTRVQDELKTRTNGKAQTPWFNSSLGTVTLRIEFDVSNEASLTPEPKSVVRAGMSFVDSFVSGSGEGPEMVYIAGGSFAFGRHPKDPDPGAQWVFPKQEKILVISMAVGKYEVSKSEFDAFVKDTNHRTSAELDSHSIKGCNVYRQDRWTDAEGMNWKNSGLSGEDLFGAPVICMSQHDATAYAEWLGKKTGRAYRLPTEQEFEFYARAGSDKIWPWGDTFEAGCDFVNGQRTEPKYGGTPCSNDSYGGDLQMRSAVRANAFGLVHVLGNASEWTSSCYRHQTTNGIDCNSRMIRGGCFVDGPQSLRPSHRVPYMPMHRSSAFGFLVVRDLSQTERDALDL